ncbi:MAG: SDR family NAD(P)-dependent oxidoreductase [Deltaproteobacteria bacterium]|nr:SDR family NAD(P)-dependent oxidoreductase [Deltaproteobacteria bacterium]MBW2219768.1 SDR family NAD(P)-dependent oxidoreductase [Deltaproteobacteria bacterium]
MKILVTGGAGFIGSHTADALIQKGHKVKILDNLHKTVHPKGKPSYVNSKAEFIEGDVRDKKTFKHALDGVDAVFHFAAYQDYLPDFSTYFHVNSVSTALLYEILVEMGDKSKVNKVVVAASQAVMGEGRYKCPNCFPEKRSFIYPEIRLEGQLSEGIWEHTCEKCRTVLEWQPSDETVINPCNQYAISKHSQEQIAIQMGKRYSIPSVVMRYSIVQGPRQSFYNAYSGAMRIFALNLYFDHQPTIFEDGKQIRDFVNIFDVVHANLLVLENKEADYRVFNVGGGKAITVIDFYNTMQRVVNKNIEPIMSDYYRYGDTRHIFSDISSLSSIGWQPAGSIEDSIQTYWEYLSSQNEIDDTLEYAQKHMKNLQVIRKAKQS